MTLIVKNSQVFEKRRCTTFDNGSKVCHSRSMFLFLAIEKLNSEVNQNQRKTLIISKVQVLIEELSFKIPLSQLNTRL